MNSTIIVAIISFIGTLIGTAGGIITSGKLTEYRLEKLEKKVDSLSESTARIPILEEKISNIRHRIADIENTQPCEFFENLQ